MNTRIVAIGLSAFLLVASSAAWAQAPAPAVTNAPPGAPVWHGDVAAGLSLARGNANTFLMNASASANNVWDQNELHLGADGVYALNNYGQTNQTRAAEAVHGFTEYKRLFTDRFYGDLRIDGTHDDIALVRYRIVVGPAVGYYVIKTDATKLSFNAGASFLDEKLGADSRKHYMTLRLAERYDHNLTKSSKVWEEVDYYPQLNRFSNYLVDAEAGVEAAINAHFSLRVVADDHFNSEPAIGSKENDIILVSSLVYKY